MVGALASDLPFLGHLIKMGAAPAWRGSGGGHPPASCPILWPTPRSPNSLLSSVQPWTRGRRAANSKSLGQGGQQSSTHGEGALRALCPWRLEASSPRLLQWGSNYDSGWRGHLPSCLAERGILLSLQGPASSLVSLFRCGCDTGEGTAAQCHCSV